MDIKDILDSLGLNLADPETKRGAVDAIKAILDSRTPPPNLSGAGGMPMPPGEIDVDVDPDLIQPSQKHRQQPDDADVEIEDEEDILSQVKHNQSEDTLDNDGNNEGDDSSANDNSEASSSDSESDSKDSANSASQDASGTSSDSDDSENADGGEYAEASDDASEKNDSTKNGASAEEESTEDKEDTSGSEDADALDDAEETEDDFSAKESSTDEYDENESEADESETEDELTDDEEELESEEDSEESEEEDEEIEGSEDEDTANEEPDEFDFDEDEFDFDEDDLVDDELKNAYDDLAQKSKHEARKIKRERTLSAAKKALQDAKTRNVAQSLIRELEKSIEALESLVEAAQKNLRDLSDEEFNLMINRVFDAISAVGDKDLTFTTDEERELQAQEIKTDLDSRETKQALSDEDIAAIRAETQAVKARDKETAVYRRPSSSSFRGFKDFLNSLYRAIALQVQTDEEQDDTWSAINRRYGGTGVLKQGKRLNELPNEKIPTVDFYFDQSGSWNENDILAGKKAVEALVDMEEKGQIKINIYYFSNHVFNDAASARAEGGTNAWNDIVKNIIATDATNVVIMTDSDMEDRWSLDWPAPPALKYTVPGFVWYLWRDGDNAPRLPRDLKGRGGVLQYSFRRGDV